MAGPRDSRMLSVMSSIKCAGCGKAIDIVALADHLCEANLGESHERNDLYELNRLLII